MTELVGRNFRQDEAKRLLEKDSAEKRGHGQQTRKTFQLADVHVHVNGEEQAKAQVRRLVELLLSHPFHPPDRDEHAMFMAYSAAMRSGDLSRQIGAVVTNRNGDIIAVGANEVPAPNGGAYWPSVEAGAEVRPDAGPDYLRGYDSNERERNRILARVVEALVPGEAPSKDEVQDEEKRLKREIDLATKYEIQLKETGLLDLTEFGRAVHAEMAALMACARSGASPLDGTVYSTTFPCHNCTKHLVAAGIRRVVYIEPYPKSKARQLHDDSIVLVDEELSEIGDEDKRVRYEAFMGVGPRRFVDLFSLVLGSGRPLERKRKGSGGARIEWPYGERPPPRLALDPRSYIEREKAAAKMFSDISDIDAKIDRGGEP